VSTQRLTRRSLLLGSWFPFFHRKSVKIAGTEFRIERKGKDRRHYIWIHGSEITARSVLLAHIRRFDGRAFFVQNTERNIPIDGGVIDPNRMFSNAGATANLRTLNPTWTEEQVVSAVQRLEHDRPRFLNTILPKDGRLLVALHNNTPSYSALDEVPISDAVSIKNEDRPHEFMLCTQRPDFDALAASDFNVLLQNRVPPTDDGSLSRVAAARGIRYVNIEAAYGNVTAQTAMLNWVERALPR
jgi:hypothetical protein